MTVNFDLTAEFLANAHETSWAQAYNQCPDVVSVQETFEFCIPSAHTFLPLAQIMSLTHVAFLDYYRDLESSDDLKMDHHDYVNAQTEGPLLAFARRDLEIARADHEGRPVDPEDRAEQRTRDVYLTHHANALPLIECHQNESRLEIANRILSRVHFYLPSNRHPEIVEFLTRTREATYMSDFLGACQNLAHLRMIPDPDAPPFAFVEDKNNDDD